MRARFTITAAGALSFTTPPDFEAPTDADGNNVYQVTLPVSDGTTSATLNLAVTVTNAGPGRLPRGAGRHGLQRARLRRAGAGRIAAGSSSSSRRG